MTRKTYTKQVPPDIQESPLTWDDDFYNGVITDGNRRYKSRKTPEYERLRRFIDDAACAFEDILNKAVGAYSTVTEAVHDYFYPSHKEKYTTHEIKKWKDILLSFQSCSVSEEHEIYCQALNLMTGKRYAYSMIKGDCQGDWQGVYYPADECGENIIRNFETEYFNLGSQWIISEDDREPEEPEDIEGYSVYCYSWSDDGIREEIARHTGTDPGNVVLFKFHKYEQHPIYCVA